MKSVRKAKDQLHLILLSALLLLLICGVAECKTVYVSTTGSDSNDGSSWQLAKRGIQAAMNISEPGDSIWVAKGTYSETAYLYGKRSLYGGFAGTEANLSKRPSFPRPSIDPNETKIDGMNMMPPYNNSIVDLRYDCKASDTRIDGFTITRGHGVGGGIRCWGL